MQCPWCTNHGGGAQIREGAFESQRLANGRRSWIGVVEFGPRPGDEIDGRCLLPVIQPLLEIVGCDQVVRIEKKHPVATGKLQPVIARRPWPDFG